jgi:ribonuclease-3
MRRRIRILLGVEKSPYAELERRMGYHFRRLDWLEQALTHRSFRFERPGVTADNQRLEFLGDAVLGLLTAAHLFHEFADQDEGGLTELRSRVTSGKALTRCARELKLGLHLRIGKGEEKSGGRHRASNLADALEAIMGAAYLDGGWVACEKIFAAVFAPLIAALGQDVWAENPKGQLQEYCQRRWRAGPQYRTVRREGPAHAAVFTAEVTQGGNVYGVGRGSNKQEAETQAAVDALRRLHVRPAAH